MYKVYQLNLDQFVSAVIMKDDEEYQEIRFILSANWLQSMMYINNDHQSYSPRESACQGMQISATASVLSRWIS